MALINFNRSKDIIQLKEDLKAQRENETLFQERIAELELAIEDQDWDKLGDTDKELSKGALNQIARTARLYWMKNPLIRRAVITKTQYIFGQGVTFEGESNEVNEVVQDFIQDKKNRDILIEQEALIEKETELELFGNLFIVLITDVSSGRVRVRTIPFEEITEIITDPEDKSTALFYKREFNKGGKQTTILYPDWNNRDYEAPNGVEVSDNLVYHISVNKLSDMKYGVSEVYSAIDWAKAYKSFLEDWATIVNAQSRFAWKVKIKGGSTGVSKVKNSLGSTFGRGTNTEGNPPPAAGSTWVENQGVNLDPMKTPGPPTSAKDGDKMIHMVSAGTGIFYHYLTGDPSTGNLATAKSMERPMELDFKNRQTLWVSAFQKIFTYVIEQSVKAPSGKLDGSVEEDFYGDEVIFLGRDDNGEEISKYVNVTFPDLLEKDITNKVNAIINAATLNGRPLAGTIESEQVTRMLLQALEVENIEEIMQTMFPEESQKVDWKQVFKDQMEELKESLKDKKQ